MFLMRVYAADAVPDSLIEAARVDGAGELPDLLAGVPPPARARHRHGDAVHARGDLEQLLPAAHHAEQRRAVPADGRPRAAEATSAAGGGAQALFSTVITGSFVSIIPLVIAFLYLQRYWQTGLATGGVKG